MSRPAWRWQGLALSLAMSLVVATLLTAVQPRPDAVRNTVASLSIGLFCWALFAAGFNWLTRRHPHPAAPWPGPARMAALVLLAAPTGAGLGLGLTRLLLGPHAAGHALADPAQSWRHGGFAVAVSIAISVIVSAVFYLRGRLAAAEARAQAAQRLASEATLQRLQAQLEPHMLFNTLANLRVLVRRDPPAAQEMLDHVIAWLRSTLQASQQRTHPLQQEFEHLRHYLALMQVRMGERLAFELRLPPALAAVPVPPLLLQPLVENAIRHGLEPSAEAGRLIVEASATAGPQPVLRLQVLDNGVGPSAPDGREGYGLRHVRERIAHQWGPGATLTLAPALPSAGLSATLEIPLLADDAQLPATAAPMSTVREATP